MMTFSRLILSALFAVSLSACDGADAPSISTPTKDKSMLVILTSPDPETQLMALVLTNAAINKGAQPHILLCSDAGDLALRTPPEAALTPLKPKEISPQQLLKKVMSSGATVEVCAIYLPNRTIETDALLAGVDVAKPDEIAERFMRDGETILTF